MIEAINTWLANGCNYAEGVTIYSLYGSDFFLRALFKKAESAINRQKLSQALVTMRDQAAAEIPEIPIIPEIPVIDFASEKRKITPQAYEREVLQTPVPEERPQLPAIMQVQKLRDQSHQEIRALHPYLSTYPEGPELQEVALRLVRLAKNNAQHWQTYNHILEHGPDPDPEPVAPVMVDHNLIDKYEAARKSLSKAKSRLAKQAKPNANTLSLIAEKTKLLQDLKAEIARQKEGGKQ